MERFDPGVLRSSLAAVPDTWSLPSTYEATKVHHGYRRLVLVDAGQWSVAAGPFRFVLDAFAPVFGATLSIIEPGGFIVSHQDAGPWWERWQVPILPAGVFVQDGVEIESVAGEPFEVRHWAPHSVLNDTDRRRVHLIVDRAVRVNRKATPFASFVEERP